MSTFCYDIWLQILENLEGCDDTLYRCLLVNWELYSVASKLLYKCIQLGRTKDSDDTLDARQESQFLSSILPRNAPHVLVLRVSGRIPPDVLHRLLPAVQAYRNLYSATLSPRATLDFAPVVRALRGCRSLRELAVTDKTRQAPLLIALDGLRKLTIADPTRAVLQLLPVWLGRLAPSLAELHLTGNCGSVTPGVLRQLLPHLQRVRALTLGLSYSLTDADVFAALAALPRLESAQLQYYLQLKTPPPVRLPALRALTVRHPPMHLRADVRRLCAWIRRVLAHAAALQSLRVVCDGAPGGASVSFAGLADHLAAKHARTLRVLRMPAAFVGVGALRALCTCAHLEELEVALGESGLWRFAQFAANMQKLHTVAFDLRNVRRAAVPAAAVWDGGPPSLRRFTLNGTPREVRGGGETWHYLFH